MKNIELKIDGMACGHCVGAVGKVLGTLPGVTVENVTIGSAAVAYDENAVSAEHIAQVVTAAGYRTVASA
jgi:copper chaperone